MKRIVWPMTGIVFMAFLGLTATLLAQEQPATPAVPLPAPAQERVILDDDLPATATTEGNWMWDAAVFSSGTKSHGHPSAKGVSSHGATLDPVAISAEDMLTQQVWLDPQDPPKGIMLKFKLVTGKEVGVYWEGEEEVFNPGEEEEIWYYGLLPELGQWTPLEVLAEDLGLEGEQVVGVSFITFDGRALWDKLAIVPAPPAEELEEFPVLPEEEAAPPAAPGQ